MSDPQAMPDDQPVADEQPMATPETAAQSAAQAGSQTVEDANQQVMRAQAELENFRKRMRREMENERRYAALPLIRDLLTVMDNLQRAIDSAEQHEDASGLLEGVKMVSQQLSGVLEKNHCYEIQALGESFDPNLHEAIAQEPSDELPAGAVTRVTQSGYRLHDRVVRPTQVLVSRGPAS